jgi:hypothetical protein
LPVAALVEAVGVAFVAAEPVAALAVGAADAPGVAGALADGRLATVVAGATVAGADAVVLGPHAATTSTSAARGRTLFMARSLP